MPELLPPPPMPPGATLTDQLAGFEALLQVQVTLYDFAQFFVLDGQRVFPHHHGAHDRCGFCRHVKDDLGHLRDCLRCDMEPMVQREQRAATWRRCHAGVWEVVYPLWDGLGFIGALNVGCFRRAGETPDADLAGPLPRAAAADSAHNPPPLRHHHRALREMDPVTEAHLPALVEALAQGLIRNMARLRRAGQSQPPGQDRAAPAGKRSASAGDARHERSRAIDLFFRTHLAQGVQLADLAAYLHLSTARTSQILRRELNTTFPALVRKMRLTEARRLLTVSELPIGRIAELAGFVDRNYFCRVFSRELRMTPTEYRRKHVRALRA